jgi:hypothetical protein
MLTPVSAAVVLLVPHQAVPVEIAVAPHAHLQFTHVLAGVA